jgi:hypothetical protein
VDDLGALGQVATVLQGGEERPWSCARAPDKDTIAGLHALDCLFGRDDPFTPVLGLLGRGFEDIFFRLVHR